jgi:glycosyltransferase involved in cell wall biosynthesis
MTKKPWSLPTEILHDYFAIKGGGEKLVLTLGEELQLPVIGGFVNSQVQFDDFNLKIKSLNAWQTLPWQFFSLVHRWSHYQSNAKQRIYSGVYAPLAIGCSQAQRHILYCHTPPRFVYDQKAYFLRHSSPLARPCLTRLMGYFQPRYEQAVAQMDVVIANSQHVQQRIQHYLGRDSQVIYPPCDTQGFRYLGQGDYYLSTARLDGLKRVEQIIKAFVQMPDKKLVVASGGQEARRLQTLAAGCDNIQFTGWLDDKQLKQWVGHCIATLYLPRQEDFGISPVESMAAGKPVIGIAEGGLLETLRHQETGILLKPSDDDALVVQIMTAVRQLDKNTAQQLRPYCEQRAQKFTTTFFLQQMRQLLI